MMQTRFPVYFSSTGLCLFLILLSHDGMIQRASATVCDASFLGGASPTTDWVYASVPYVGLLLPVLSLLTPAWRLVCSLLSPFNVASLIVRQENGEQGCSLPNEAMLRSNCLTSGIFHEGSAIMSKGWNMPTWAWTDRQHTFRDSGLPVYFGIPAANCLIDFTPFKPVGLAIFPPSLAEVSSSEQMREHNRQAAAEYRAARDNANAGTIADTTEIRDRGVEQEAEATSVTSMQQRSQRHWSTEAQERQMQQEAEAASADFYTEPIQLASDSAVGPVEEQEVAMRAGEEKLLTLSNGLGVFGLVIAIWGLKLQIQRTAVAELTYLENRAEAIRRAIWHVDSSVLSARDWLDNSCWCHGCPSQDVRNAVGDDSLEPFFDSCCNDPKYKDDPNNGVLMQQREPGSQNLFTSAAGKSHVARYDLGLNLRLVQADGRSPSFEKGIRLNEGRGPGTLIGVFVAETHGNLNCMPLVLKNAPIKFRNQASLAVPIAITGGAILAAGGYAYKREKDKKDARAKRRADRRAKRAARKSAGAAGTSGSRGSRKSIGSSKAARSSSKARSTGSRKSTRSNRA